MRLSIRIFFLTGLLYLASCQKFLDVNVSPNSPSEVGEAFILPSICASVGFNQQSDIARFSLLFSQQFASVPGVQTGEFDKYLVTATDVNNSWNNYYQVALADIQTLIDQAEANGNPRYAGIGKILKAYVFHNLVDVWGDVPFSQALQGSAAPNPAYDRSEDIYSALFTLIDEGIAAASLTEGATPTADDLIYGGNMERWVKFANTLKLRLYLHYSEVNPSFATQGMTALINSGAAFMTDNADNFQLAYEANAGRQNPFHQFETSRPNQMFPSRTLVDLMNAKDDPRRAHFFTPTPIPQGYNGVTLDYDLDTYVGSENANAVFANNPGIGRMHSYIRGTVTSGALTGTPPLASANVTYNGNAPTRMLTFAEYNFIRAEAALRLGVPGDAETFFQAGIIASQTLAGVPAARRTDYITANGTLSGTPAEQLQQIIEEKYVANYGVAVEPWTDWRRTGFPELNPIAPALSPSNGGVVPSTLFYPQNELDSNPNTPSRPNLNTRVFWDTRSR